MNCSKDGIKIEGASCSYNNKCIYPKCINDMNKEYVIIDKSLLEKRIEELENTEDADRKDGIEIYKEMYVLKQILSQSTPLIPEIEKAFDEGKGVGIISYQPQWHTLDKKLYNDRKHDYISNLKLDI